MADTGDGYAHCCSPHAWEKPGIAIRLLTPVFTSVILTWSVRNRGKMLTRSKKRMAGATKK